MALIPLPSQISYSVRVELLLHKLQLVNLYCKDVNFKELVQTTSLLI